jgi:hypothetical protein
MSIVSKLKWIIMHLPRWYHHHRRRPPEQRFHLFMYAYVFEDCCLYVKEVPLTQQGEPHMAAPFSAIVGQTIDLSIIAKDQSGNMFPLPTPDSPPVWAVGNPAVDTLTPAADGLTATDLCVTAGTDTVSLTVVVAGVSFAASMPLTVAAALPVLTSVDIVAVVAPAAPAAPAPLAHAA